MQVWTPPQIPSGHLTNTLFLGGSIEMGKAIEWQKRIIAEFSDVAGNIYNPRRDDWDSSWAPGSPELEAQIDWELAQIGECATIFLYFQGETLSPISLLELGMACQMQEFPTFAPTVIVVCDTNFWRRTNVLRTCNRFGVTVYDDLESGIKALRERVEQF